jgi:hypothetical protein
MGHYYELGFRDLYATEPYCDCMHTYKILDDITKEIYHESFEFKCKNLGRTTSIIDEVPVALKDFPGVYNQSMSWTNPKAPIPGLDEAVFNTATIAFKEVPGQEQYEWVIEFTCGTQPEDFMKHMFPGECLMLLFARGGKRILCLYVPLNISHSRRLLMDVMLVSLSYFFTCSFRWVCGTQPILQKWSTELHEPAGNGRHRTQLGA